MPRYHFKVMDGHSEIDHDGTELPDVLSARIEALRLAGEIIKDAAHLASLGSDWRVEVTDDRGLMLFRMGFVVMDSPYMRK